MEYVFIALWAVILFVLYRRFFRKKRTSQIEQSSNNAGTSYPPVARISIPIGIIPAQDFTVPSFAEPGVVYTVSFPAMTCTCPDFDKRRKHIAAPQLDRACKHIRRIIDDSGALRGTIYEAVLSSEYTSAHYFTLADQPFIIGFTPGKEWINVYGVTRHGKDGIVRYQRYGYSLAELRWSYGEAPSNREALEEIIQQHFPSGPSFRKSYLSNASIQFRDAFSLTDESQKKAVAELYNMIDPMLEDGVIDAEEMKLLNDFIARNIMHLNASPLDRLLSIVQNASKDGRISKAERQQVFEYLTMISKAIG